MGSVQLIINDEIMDNLKNLARAFIHGLKLHRIQTIYYSDGNVEYSCYTCGKKFN